MPRLPRTTQVLVAGAGPTGLALAALLEAAGTKVTVVDRAPRRSREARASVLHSRGIEILDTLGAAGALLDEGAPINSMACYDMGLPVAEVRFDDLDSVFPFALGIGQNRVEAALLDRLADAGTRVHRSATLEQATNLGDGVNAVLRDADGGAQEVTAEWLVACDGANSTVRQLLATHGGDQDQDQDVDEGGGEEELDTYVLATVEVRGGIDDMAMHAFSAPDGFCVLSPLPGGVFRLTANMADAPNTPTTEQLRAVLNSRGPRTGSLTIAEPTYVARYRLRRSVAHQMRAGRILLAGDAAHTFSPVGGQGMNTGLHDAANLAWKLAAVCAGTAPVRLVETYEAERHKAAREAFDRTERLTGALSEPNPLLRGARDVLAMVATVVPPLRQPLQRGLAGMDAVYSPGTYADGAVTEGPWLDGWGRPGERMDTIPPGLLTDQRHHLVLTGRGVMGGDVERLLDLAARHTGGIAVHVIDPEAVVGARGPRRHTVPWPGEDPAERPAPQHAHVLLIRPDGHIGWSGRLEDADRLGVHMDRWMARS